jgi:hypothetical protein
MKSRDHLFRLIHSLNPAEKRFFHRFASRHKKGKANKNLVLYQAIESQEEFDEQALRIDLKGESLLNQLPVAKIYLRDLLLESLCQYHRGKSKAGALRQCLDQVEILFQKGLPDSALLILRKGKIQALKHNYHTAALDLLRWEQKILKQQASGKDFQKVMEMQQEERQLIENLRTESELRMLHDRIFALLNRRLNRSDSEFQAEIASILQDPILSMDPSGLPFNSRLIQLYIQLYADQARNELASVTVRYSEMVALWESSPERIAAEQERYLMTRMGLLESYHLARAGDDFMRELAALRSLPVPKGRLAATRFYFTFHLELLHVMNTGQPPLTPDLGVTMQQGLEDHTVYLGASVRLSLMFNLCSYFFSIGQYSPSLRLVNNIVNEPEEEVRKDIRLFSRCIRLMLHFELGNHDLLDYLLPSAQRLLERNKAGNTLGIMLVRRLKQLLAVPFGSQGPLWEDFRDDLAELKKEQGDSLLGMAEVDLWVKSKVERKSMQEVIISGQ